MVADQVTSRTILRQTVLAGAGILVAVITSAESAPKWPLGFVALAGALGLWGTNRWVYRTLLASVTSRGAEWYIRVCALAMANLILSLSLLNLTAHLLWPGTFRSASGNVNLLDVLYFTLLTFSSGGYGDITPATAIGKALAMTTTLFGFFYASTLCAAVLQLTSGQRRA